MVGAIGLVVVSAGGASAALQHNTTFAGYTVYAPKLSAGTATFTIPRVTCGVSSSGVGPGLFALSKKGLTGGGTLVACVNGAPVYQVGSVINGNEKNTIPVSPGDLVKVSVSETTKGTSVSVNDLTAKTGDHATGKGGALTAFLVGTAAISQNNTQFGVDPFTTVHFSRVTFNGKPLGSYRTIASERVRGKTVQIVPTAITNGRGFKLVFKHS